MIKRTPGWVAPALAMGLLGFALYGYNEHQQRSAMIALSGNHIQADYHGLAFDVDEMQDDLAKAQVTQTPELVSGLLEEAGRRATAARVFAARLPLNAWPDGAAMTLLDHTTTLTAHMASTITAGQRLTSEDQKQLHSLYLAATELDQQLRTAQTGVMAENSQSLLTTGSPSSANSRGGALTSVLSKADGTARQFTELGHGTLTGERSADKLTSFPALQQGQIISASAAIRLVRKFSSVADRVDQATVERLGAGYGYPGYLVTLPNLGPNRMPLTAGVSLHGGHVIWLSAPETGSGVRLSSAQATKSAEAYLHSHGYSGVDLLDTDRYGEVGVFTFAPVKSKVAMYNQTLLVKVNLGSGHITGFDASAFWTAATPKVQTLQPTITEAIAKRGLAPGMKAEHIRLAVIAAIRLQPRLVYDILGRTQDNTFHVYVDAHSGKAINIEKVTKEEAES